MSDRTRSAEALVAADIAHVWDVITDLPRTARWSPEIKDSRWTSRRRVAAISTGDQIESRISLGDFRLEQRRYDHACEPSTFLGVRGGRP